jgi:hypothetical protein
MTDPHTAFVERSKAGAFYEVWARQETPTDAAWLVYCTTKMASANAVAEFLRSNRAARIAAIEDAAHSKKELTK